MILRASLGVIGFTSLAGAQSWQPLNSGVTAELRGVSAVNAQVVWATGSGGTVLRTTDGGLTWHRRPVPQADSLDFRDVHAFDAEHAIILAIGPGDRSRIYDTTDGGMTWTLRFRNARAEAFFDCLAFWDARRGIAVSDPVDGKYVVIVTDDAGRTWRQSPREGMPDAVQGEGAFAASGTCVAVGGSRLAWFTTGGVAQPRIFRSADGGGTWTAHEAPLAGGSAGAGVFSIAFRGTNGVAVGGDYEKPAGTTGVLALSEDAGRSWSESTAPADSLPRGYRSAVAFTSRTGDELVAVGTNGSDYSVDGGRSWRALGDTGYHAVSVAPDGYVWAVGPRGRIARMAMMERIRSAKDRP